MQHVSAASSVPSVVAPVVTTGGTTITLGGPPPLPKSEHKEDGKPPHGIEMYKVNIEDISQLFTYHEVFGKIHGDVVNHQLAAAHGGQLPPPPPLPPQVTSHAASAAAAAAAASSECESCGPLMGNLYHF